MKRNAMVRVQVKPSAKTDAVEAGEDGALRVSVKAAPEDGKANLCLRRLLARHFGVPLRAVAIRRGASSRSKLVEVVFPE